MNGSPSYAHLGALTDDRGLFEHALRDVPRPEHGYCVDDVARALIVVVREPDRTTELTRLGDIYLGFLESALAEDGSVRNRMDVDGEWTDEPVMGDWWGRLVWAMGTVVATSDDPAVRRRALAAFHRAAAKTTSDVRTLAFATLGASDVLVVHPHDEAALRIVRDLVAAVPPTGDQLWPWPEERLRYANAAVPDALIAAGVALDDAATRDRGLHLLGFLLGRESREGRLSVSGSAGRGRDETHVLFDQQPIEVAAIADACARAYDETREPLWAAWVAVAWRWFEGANDGGTPMFDDVTGAGFDGLEPHGRNDNRGAESTLAALSTYQQARRILHPVDA